MEDLEELLRESLALQEKQAALTKQIAELQAKKKEEERSEALKKEIEKPLHVTVSSFVEEKERLVLRANYRSDYVEMMRTVPNRFYSSIDKTNEVSLEGWEETKSKILALPNSAIEYNKDVEESITSYVNRPLYVITVRDKGGDLIVQTKPLKTNASLIVGIPGTRYDTYKSGIYYVSISEGWRLWDNLSSVENDEVSWSLEAKDIVVKEVEQRALLDTIGTAKDVDLTIPVVDKEFKYMPFQRVTVKFIQTTLGRAICANQMGLGKTACAIGYCLINDDKDMNVIICPANLMENWRREIIRLTGFIPYMFRGSIPGVLDLKRLMMDKPRYSIFNYDILARKKETFKEITTEDGRKYKTDVKERYMWIDIINSLFKRAIIDEAHKIKNSESQRSEAIRQLTLPEIIFLTGTPVLNRPGELWPMLNILEPSQFPSEEGFIKKYTFDGKTARNVDELRQVLKTRMIRFLKKDVMPDLPPIQRVVEFYELSEKAQKLYDKVLQWMWADLESWDPSAPNSEKEVPNLLAQIMRLKQVCSIDKMDRIAELATNLYDTHENGGPAKVVIFSQFKRTVDGIAKRLGGEVVTVHGGMSKDERQEAKDRFQTDKDIHYMVATWQTAGEGFDLTEGAYCIFADLFWTPAHHQQSEERLYGRLNDAHGATSYYVTAQCRAEGQECIEEWIQNMLKSKLDVINQVVEGIDKERDSSIATELLHKMKHEMYKLKGKK